jgi:hypothetical protein
MIELTVSIPAICIMAFASLRYSVGILGSPMCLERIEGSAIP